MKGDRFLLRGSIVVVAHVNEVQGDPPRLFCKVESDGNTGAYLLTDLTPLREEES